MTPQGIESKESFWSFQAINSWNIKELSADLATSIQNRPSVDVIQHLDAVVYVPNYIMT